MVATETVPVRTVNRQCSSGLQAIADVVAAIKAGFYDIGTLYTTSQVFHIVVELSYRTRLLVAENILSCLDSVFSKVCYLHVQDDNPFVFAFNSLVDKLVDSTGIGGGLESMSVNPMAWEGSVNPRVSALPILHHCFIFA